jgi:hypothetical protein
MPVDPTTDPDFMKAPPHEQMAYLTHTDPDFAKASPQDQFAYMSHIHGLNGGMAPAANAKVDMQPSYTDIGLKGGTTGEGPRNPYQPAERFALENPKERGTLLGAASIGAVAPVVATAAPILGPIAGRVARKVAPWAAPAVASYAINRARELPVVGPVIKHIPFAEMIPWMFAGGNGKPEAEPEYPGATEPTATPEQLNPSLVSPVRTLPGQVGREVIQPHVPPVEPLPQRRGLMLPPAAEVGPVAAEPTPGAVPSQYGPPKTDFRMNVPAENQGFDFSPAKDYGAQARVDVERRMGALPRGGGAAERRAPVANEAPAVPSSYPPDRPSLVVRGPIPGSPEDIAETRAIQEQARETGDLENRISRRAARNDLGRMPTKGELTEAAGAQTPPVKLTKTRGVSGRAGSKARLAPVAPVEENLAPEWERALDEIKKKKGKD